MLRCDRDGLFRQGRPDSGPSELEPDLTVLEINGGSPVIGGCRQTVDIATPPPMGITGLFQNPSNLKTAPNHLVVVIHANAIDDMRPQCDGFQIVGHHPMFPKPVSNRLKAAFDTRKLHVGGAPVCPSGYG